MRSIIMLAGGGVAGIIWPKLPLVAKAGIAVGLISLTAIELNKDYWESFYSSAVSGGQAAQGDAQTVDLRAVRRDMDDKKKPVSGAAETATVNFEEHSAAAQERQAIADAASESEETLLAKVKHHKPLTSAENLRVSEIRQRRAEATTAELAAQANAAWQPFNLRLAHQLATGTVPGDDLFQFFENASRSHR
jgi:hypothetical protein